MSLLNVRKDSGGKPAQPPKGSSMRPSSDRLARVESHLKALAGLVDAHDKRFTDQETWNAEAQSKIVNLEAAASGSCPGCGQPVAGGTHGVWCFRVADSG